jgi:hypothetical protein
MASIKHFALGLCVLCTLAGILHVFWPENSLKPVINTALVLYIISSILSIGKSTDWNSFRTQVDGWSQQLGVEQDYQDYAEQLGLTGSAQALQTLLENAGINAQVILGDGSSCRVILSDPVDEKAAQNLLDQNSGSLSCTLVIGGETP